MSKVTSKLQVTIPKQIATAYHINPGDNIGWQEAGQDALRIVLHPSRKTLDSTARLELFNQATERQQQRQQPRNTSKQDRGWKREDLYDRAG
ncbi:MAG: AbrB/MazE/SpoVT family DNA-binding domain-containing protein [Candidatus Dormibacteraceae bacterium]